MKPPVFMVVIQIELYMSKLARQAKAAVCAILSADKIEKTAIKSYEGPEDVVMRIIGGALRGREIRAPGGEATRPAMARTREALFSMLGSRGLDWPETRVLDLFAGTGSLAFEALSRGARAATLVDNSPALAETIAGTVADLGLEASARLVRADVLRFLRKSEPRGFNLVFVDPPYRRDFTTPVLAELVGRGWLVPGAYVAAEIEKGAKVAVPAGLDLAVERLFGQTMVLIWQKN